MDLLSNITLGMTTALKLTNLFYAFFGCLIGTFIGVLPGMGPLATMAMLLPMTYALSPDAALIMLAGIYYGAQYGGSTTAIMVNLPGESSTLVTTLDGHAMARGGRAGPALVTAALSSFFAGTIATLVIAALAVPLSSVALYFGPAEYFSLMVLGLLLATVLSTGSPLEGIAMIVVGLLLSTIGTDVNSGALRFTFGLPQLFDGIGFVPLAIGIFGLAEIIKNLEFKKKSVQPVLVSGLKGFFPTREDFRRMVPAMARGTVVGSFLGLLPGGGATISSFASYTLEKKIAKRPEEFGHGAIEGVAGPEAANNAGAQTSFIPLLTLGVPSNVVMALMVGAMTIHNIQPGPGVMTENPELFWGLIASMWVGNLMLVILNLPLASVWIRLLRIPYRYLYPAIIVFCLIGVYSISNDSFDIFATAVFGIAGYLILKLRLSIAPLLLGLVLGSEMEEYFRRAMLLSRGDASVFFTSPISAAFLAIAAIGVLLATFPKIQRRRDSALQE